MSEAIARFEIRVPEQVLGDLRERLARTRWPGSVAELTKLIDPLVDPEAHNDVRRWSVMPSGGHFAALEEPRALVAEIRAFFRELRP